MHSNSSLSNSKIHMDEKRVKNLVNFFINPRLGRHVNAKNAYIIHDKFDFHIRIAREVVPLQPYEILEI